MKKLFPPLFSRVASFICILSLAAGCEKFDDDDPNYRKPLPTPLPDMILYTTSDGAPVNVDSWKDDILDNCYYDGMGRIILREGVTNIPPYAFGDSKLVDIVLPETITSIDWYAFGRSQLQSIVIPNTVVSLGAEAFYGCKNLTSITVPDSVTSLGARVFSFCTNLAKVKLSENLTSIPKEAFYSCQSLRSINMPDGVTEIGQDAFSYCHSLEKIVLPQGITQTNKSFQYCSSLKEVTLNKNIKGIGGFTGCTSLKKINLPEGLETIYSYCFSYCVELERIYIPSTVREINGYVFDNCKKLKQVNLPEGIEYIGNNLFANCYELSEIRIPESVAVFNFGAFQNTAISHINIPENVSYIFDGAFIDAKNLKSFSGKFVTDDGRCVITDDGILKGFAPCGLTSYEFPEGIRQIEGFSEVNIESMTLPSSVEALGGYWFSGFGTYNAKLKTLYCKATAPPYAGFDIDPYTEVSVTVYVPRSSVEAYEQADFWKDLTIEGYDF